MGVSAVLLIVAAVLFGVAAFGVRGGPVHLGWAGACALALSFLL